MDRRAWQAIVHRVTQSWTPLKRLSTQACTVVIVVPGLSYRLWGLSSLTRTQQLISLLWEHGVLSTGLPGKSPKVRV